MKDWIMELCPEIVAWQVELIAEEAQKRVLAEREWIINLLNTKYPFTPPQIVEEIRARGSHQNS